MTKDTQEQRLVKLEADLEALSKLSIVPPDIYLTEAKFHEAMLEYVDRIGEKVSVAFDDHQRDHIRLERNIQKNEDRIDTLRNIGASIAAAATALGLWLGLK